MATSSMPASAEGDARNLLAVVVATASSAMPAFLAGTMAVQIRGSLRFSSADFGLAVGVYYLGAALSSVPASRVAERLGGIRVMRAMAISGAAVLVLLGTEARSWGSLAVLLFAGGCMSGAMGPASNLFLARRSAEQRQGFAFGVKQAAVPLASLLAGLAVPAVVLYLGWHWTFRLSALVALAAALLVPKSRLSLAEQRQRRRAATGHRVRRGPLVVLGIALGLGVMAASGTLAFLVSAAVGVGYSKGAAGVLVAVAGATAVASRVMTGVRADRRGRAHFRVVAVMMLVGTAGFALLATGLAVSSKVVVAVGAVVAFGAGWGWNGLFNFAVVRTHRVAPAEATGITQVGGRMGGVLGPVLFGLVIEHGSYADAWVMAAGAVLCAAGGVVFGRHLLVRQPAEVAAAPPTSPTTATTSTTVPEG